MWLGLKNWKKIDNKKNQKCRWNNESRRKKTISKSIAHISKYLGSLLPEPFIKPGTSAKISNIRKFMVENKYIEKKSKMEITEENAVAKWEELVLLNIENPEQDDTESDDDFFC